MKMVVRGKTFFSGLRLFATNIYPLIPKLRGMFSLPDN
jgi:hypothetical protein